jgi:hypothetical protein
MRRLLAGISIALLITLVVGAHLTLAAATTTPSPTIIAPTAGQVVNWYGDFTFSWVRVPDALFYRVQVFLPKGSTPEFMDYRYVPDTSMDIRRHDPQMKIDTGSLVAGQNHTVVVTAYGLSDKLKAQYGSPDPLTGIWPKYPTWLTFDWYTQMGQPASQTFYVDP